MIITGTSVYGNVVAQVDRTHAALRTSLRPTEKGVFGSYSVVLSTGAYSAGALTASPQMAFRWTSASSNCLIRRIRGSISTTTAFAQGDIGMDVIRGTSVTAQYTGGTVISLSGKSQARSTRFAATQQQIGNTATGNIAIASTGAIVAPTPAWTFDNFPFAITVVSGTLGINTSIIFEANPWDEPIELQAGEGILGRVTWPITGVVNPARWIIDYDEVDPARYFGNF